MAGIWMAGMLKRGREGQAYCAKAAPWLCVGSATGCLIVAASKRPPLSSLCAATSATADKAAVIRTRVTRQGRILLTRACRCRRREEARDRSPASAPPTSEGAVRGADSTRGRDIEALHRRGADG